jgi:hypothetical protein
LYTVWNLLLSNSNPHRRLDWKSAAYGSKPLGEIGSGGSESAVGVAVLRRGDKLETEPELEIM